ncbi:MAG TPA: RDD family protein [Thermoanaerobaculia bacterium]|nr:RDD family protein [Thermoanaerobaculia bacterium]
MHSSGVMEGRAGFWIRAAAASIDTGVGVASSLVLASSLGTFFAHRAVVTLRIGQPDTLWQGPLPMMLGAVGEVVYLLPFALFAAWVLDPLTGATVGKRVFGLRVRDAGGQPASRQRRWCRSALQTVGLWGCTLALVAGRWEFAVLASLAGSVVFVGSLAALGPQSLALHDRISGTSVCRNGEGRRG